MDNADSKTVDSFGDEWKRFKQSGDNAEDLQRTFEQYFSVFPWEQISIDSQGADIGSGSGRWASFVAKRVCKLTCVDASAEALKVAKHNLREQRNCEFEEASVGALPFESGSLDFVYSLGVLHHVPDTAAAIGECARVLKPGAPLLLYLYYAFGNRPAWFGRLWRVSDSLRKSISQMPRPLKNFTCDALAAGVYLPVSSTAKWAERLGMNVDHMPLAAYRNRSFYSMRTDSRDRFGTPLEQRFTREQITDMMEGANLEDIRFSNSEPFWCAVGTKAA